MNAFRENVSYRIAPTNNLEPMTLRFFDSEPLGEPSSSEKGLRHITKHSDYEYYIFVRLSYNSDG